MYDGLWHMSLIKKINRMKKLQLAFLLLSFTLTAFAQQDMIVIANPVSIGTNYIQNAEIKGTEYFFSERIDDYKIDTINGIAAVYLRGLTKNGKNLSNKGSFVLYDLIAQQPLWSRKINYVNEKITFHGGQAMLNKADKVTALDRKTGEELWSGKSWIYYVDQASKIGVSYKISGLNPTNDNMEGIDLLTGNTIWKRDLDRSYGWDDIQRLTDSTVLITSTGLHSLNIKTGEGWDYKTLTGKKQTGEAVAKGLGSVVLGVLTGGTTFVSGVDVITGVVSNTLMDNTGIYLASAEKLSKLDKDGNVLWAVDLPKDKCSASTILRKEGNIYLINKGYAYENGRFRNYGQPFIAIFDEKDGTQVFFKNFEEKKLLLNDVDIQGDTLNLLFYNKFAQLSIKNNTMLTEKSFDTKKTGYLYNFVNESLFASENESFVNVRKDCSEHLILTSNEKIIVFNGNGEEEKELNPGDFYSRFAKIPTGKMLFKDGKIVVVDNDGKKTAEINATSKAQLKGNRLYESEEKVLREIDLSGVLVR